MRTEHNLKLKVCGLTVAEQIQELIALKTDFIGFIFYEKSPRFVLSHLNLDDISKFDHRGKVGVFVNESINKIIEIAEKANLHFIQLHGNENVDFISELRKKLNPEIGIIKVFRIGENFNVEEFHTSAQSILHNISYILFDTNSTSFGGTGKQFDWNLLNEIEIPLPYFLSGGISEDHIDHVKALEKQPFALDINSKFEIEAGIKDLEKIKRVYEKL
ncbi:phosphoribosylanthranilate isomerase [Chryseobacterium daecheongense]|uniref:phosphoribosylanthranilate isomerase n=1 Tax=Chryseobacterium daecheongense TaxID=192389 RepID=UPI001FD71942|nr:phosphoribosylanthranilate isomerase [Chryseobacterium daecheongense]UOU98004.1 phosphoribosylanthranilate isomerase [Chryseobacterium daecheongense]